MKKAKLILGTTNSLPVGTSDEEIEQTYQRSYKPFLRAAYNAGLPVTLHYSGHLLQWLEKHHSEYTDVLSEMVERRQVELLGGGFYDPVLSLIPRLDRIGQIESLTTYLRKRFGRRPRGAWITEHVWEPGLPSTLRSSGMDYAFLDNSHFIAAGFTGTALRSPCITEDQGKTVLIFPVCHDLVQVAREGSPEDVIEFLRARADEDPASVCVLIDHGERDRGVVSGRDGKRQAEVTWLDSLLELIARNADWIETELPARVAKSNRPRNRAYFPSAACEEHMYGPENGHRQDPRSRPRERVADEQNATIVRGHFRQFLTRYAESNLMYAKMQYTHVLVNQVRGDKYRKQAAREELWRGQCHSSYWYGSRGGIYRNHLRKHTYQALIEAEKITRERGIFIPSIVTVDFDMDGLPEFLFQGQDINAYIHQEGGTLFELDYLPVAWNYLDTLSRRPESCHSRDERKRGYDERMRKSFMDHFLGPEVTLEEFDQAAYRDLGGFLEAIYEQVEYKREGQLLALRGEAPVVQGKRSIPLRIDKRYSFCKASVRTEYVLTNLGDRDIEAVFAPELNFAFLSDRDDALRFGLTTTRRTDAAITPRRASHAAVKELKMYDLVNGLTVVLSLSDATEMWCLPVETVSSGPDGPESEYQETCLLPRWPVTLRPEESLTRTIDLRFE